MDKKSAIEILKKIKEEKRSAGGTGGPSASLQRVEVWVSKEQLNPENAALDLAISSLEGEKSEWPNPADDYWYIDALGDVQRDIFTDVWDGHKDRKHFIGLFETKERALQKRDVIKALANAKSWVPTEQYYTWWNNNAHLATWTNTPSDKLNLAQGNCFPPNTEGRKCCEEYGALMMKEAEEIIKENS